LQPPLHAAYKGAINSHPLSHSFLAQAEGQAESTCVCSKDLANIHPQDRRQSRILKLRVIIRGSGTPIVSHAIEASPKSRWRLELKWD
jgi:hypothetical protein